jgi:hypothetical protein
VRQDTLLNPWHIRTLQIDRRNTVTFRHMCPQFSVPLSRTHQIFKHHHAHNCTVRPTFQRSDWNALDPTVNRRHPHHQNERKGAVALPDKEDPNCERGTFQHKQQCRSVNKLGVSLFVLLPNTWQPAQSILRRQYITVIVDTE